MIKSKFNCNDEVWFINLNTPVSRFIYQISRDGNNIGYFLTSTSGYAQIPSCYVDEKHLFKTKKELLKQWSDDTEI